MDEMLHPHTCACFTQRSPLPTYSLAPEGIWVSDLCSSTSRTRDASIFSMPTPGQLPQHQLLPAVTVSSICFLCSHSLTLHLALHLGCSPPPCLDPAGPPIPCPHSPQFLLPSCSQGNLPSGLLGLPRCNSIVASRPVSLTHPTAYCVPDSMADLFTNGR